MTNRDKQTTDEMYQLTGQIAAKLGEQERTPLRQIRRMLHVVGPERVQAFVAQALEIEAAGGMMLPDGSRRRTVGGVFFRLARDQLSRAEARAIWYAGGNGNAPRRQLPADRQRTAAPPVDPLEDAVSIIDEVNKRLGKATTVKLTIIGRPGEVIEKNGLVVLGMKDETRPALPKGFPPLTSKPTVYLVLVSKKQWAKVSSALGDPDDKLIIEGYPRLDPRVGATITVYATQLTTKLLQAAKRQQRQETAA